MYRKNFVKYGKNCIKYKGYLFNFGLGLVFGSDWILSAELKRSTEFTTSVAEVNKFYVQEEFVKILISF